MMKKILVLVAAAAAMAACADSPTAPAQARTANSAQRSNDLTCRGGYVVAYDELGNPYCAPADGTGTQSMTRQP